MQVADGIAQFLARQGVTDAFGIPGGVILDLLYALDRTPGVTVHLSYHEQCAAFAASGYAQCGQKVGVAFATRGPGIMNMVTSIADAYCDSNAMLVFTAHGGARKTGGMRVLENQEFDLEPMFQNISKAYIRIDELERVAGEIARAYATAGAGRKGPVVVDICSCLFSQELPPGASFSWQSPGRVTRDEREIVAEIRRMLVRSTRPVILAGEGIKQSATTDLLTRFAEQNRIPVLTSRYAEDLAPESPLYFGYIGSHAIRAANFILSKADLILGLGNRMAFPVNSQSYRPLTERTKIVRLEIDAAEFEREIPNAVNYQVDLAAVMPALSELKAGNGRERAAWISVCEKLRTELWDCDVSAPVETLDRILRSASSAYVITSDVGNNELWLSRAYIRAKIANPILYSKTFGALGCSVGKAIGAHYATNKPVICVVGDQGLQLNLQELQVIATNSLPIAIVLLNNHASGMIREHEEQKYGARHLLATEESGYATIDAEKIAAAYAIPYQRYEVLEEQERAHILCNIHAPLLLEVQIDRTQNVTPNLKKGDPCQKLYPYLDPARFARLDAL